MSRAWTKRTESLKKELTELPSFPAIPSVILSLAGGPSIIGSQGIEAQLAARLLDPYQEMVKTQFSENSHGPVGQRGPRRGEEEARLFLTALPKGSFGLELSNPLIKDEKTSQELTKTLVQITRVIEAAGLSEEDFSAQIEEVSPRTLLRMKDFLGVLAKHETSLTIENGELRCELKQEQIAIAKQRVDETKTESDTVPLQGALRGVLLDSWRFDFLTTTGTQISGKISDDIDESTAAAWIRFINQPCQINVEDTTVTTPGGHIRHKYKVLNIDEIQPPQMQVLQST